MKLDDKSADLISDSKPVPLPLFLTGFNPCANNGECSHECLLSPEEPFYKCGKHTTTYMLR